MGEGVVRDGKPRYRPEVEPVRIIYRNGKWVLRQGTGKIEMTEEQAVMVCKKMTVRLKL